MRRSRKLWIPSRKARRLVFLTRPSRRSIPRKFRSGYLCAASTRNFPGPEPRSTSTRRSFQKTSENAIGERISGGTISSASSGASCRSASALSKVRLVHRVISRRHTGVGQLADFQGGPSQTGSYDEHIQIDENRLQRAKKGLFSL